MFKSLVTKLAKFAGVEVVTENNVEAVNTSIVENHAPEVFKKETKTVKPSKTVKPETVVTVEPKAKVSRARLTPEIVQERNEHLFNLGYVVLSENDAQNIYSYTGRKCGHKAEKIYIDYKGQKQIGIPFADYIAYWNKLGKMVQRTAIKEYNNKQVKQVQTAVNTAVVKEIKEITAQKPKQPTQAELDAQKIAELTAQLERFNNPKGKTTTARKPAVKTAVKSQIEVDNNGLETEESASLQPKTKKKPTITPNELKAKKLANLTK